MAQYLLGLYEKAMPNQFTLPEKLAAAKKLGYDYVEPEHRRDRPKAPAPHLDEVRAPGAGSGHVRRGAAHPQHLPERPPQVPLGSNDPATVARSLEIMEQAIELADDLGVRTIQLAGYDVYYEQGSAETKKRFTENILRSTELAARHGVVLGFETMETPFMNTVGKAMEYVALADSSYLTVYPDLGNLTNAAKTYQTSVEDDIRTGKGHLCAMHLKETVPGVFREVPFGTGHVDFQKGIETAWQCGVRRFVTEMWDVGNGTWEAEIQKAVTMMRQLLDRQG